MSAADVVRAAQAFDRDGHRDPIVTKLLKECTRGQNVERAMDDIDNIFTSKLEAGPTP